jgi:hypothetical protein
LQAVSSRKQALYAWVQVSSGGSTAGGLPEPEPDGEQLTNQTNGRVEIRLRIVVGLL